MLKVGGEAADRRAFSAVVRVAAAVALERERLIHALLSVAGGLLCPRHVWSCGEDGIALGEQPEHSASHGVRFTFSVGMISAGVVSIPPIIRVLTPESTGPRFLLFSPHAPTPAPGCARSPPHRSGPHPAVPVQLDCSRPGCSVCGRCRTRYPRPRIPRWPSAGVRSARREPSGSVGGPLRCSDERPRGLDTRGPPDWGSGVRWSGGGAYPRAEGRGASIPSRSLIAEAIPSSSSATRTRRAASLTRARASSVAQAASLSASVGRLSRRSAQASSESGLRHP
jgi:hypothetical protein